jgi:hypothetical protein
MTKSYFFSIANSVAVASKSEIYFTAFLTLDFIFFENEYGSLPILNNIQLTSLFNRIK